MSDHPIELSSSDWQEIYYALLDKDHAIECGRYGERDADGVNDGEWITQLRNIAAEIGPDGRLAAGFGTAPDKNRDTQRKH